MDGRIWIYAEYNNHHEYALNRCDSFVFSVLTRIDFYKEISEGL